MNVKQIIISFSFLPILISSSNDVVLRDLPINKSLSYIKNTSTRSLYVTNAKKYETEHFIIYYGSNPPKTSLWADSDNNGIPDFVEKLGKILENVWKEEVYDLGFPYPYGSIPIPVYVANTGLYLNGQILTLSSNICGFSAIKDEQSFIVVNANPPYSPYTNPVDMLKITLAHEFFHLIQFSYKLNSDETNLWLYEGTAVLMERLVYPDIKDYLYSYAPEFLSHPERGLIYYYDLLHPYSTVLFFDYLYNKYGINIIQSIWENFKYTNSSVEAVKNSLGGEESFLNELYAFYKNLKNNPYAFSNPEILSEIEKENLKILNEGSYNHYPIWNYGAIYTNETQIASIFNPYKGYILLSEGKISSTWVNKEINDSPLVVYWKNNLQNPISIRIINPQQVYSYFIHLHKGWNLINFKENFDISSLKDYIKYAWKWNGSNWEIYIPDNYPDLIKKAKEYGLSFFTEVKPLEGVWIYSKYDLDIEGGFSYGNYTLNLNHTWNLVGNPSFADLNFTDLYNSSNFTIAWVWNVNNQKWEVFIPPDNKELIEVTKKYNIPLILSLNGTDYKGFWLKK